MLLMQVDHWTGCITLFLGVIASISFSFMLEVSSKCSRTTQGKCLIFSPLCPDYWAIRQRSRQNIKYTDRNIWCSCSSKKKSKTLYLLAFLP